MDHLKTRVAHYAIYALLLFGVAYIFVLHTVENKPLQALHMTQNSPTKSYVTMEYKDELQEALASTSTKGKTVIITIIDKAYVEGYKPMLDLFLDAFWVGERTRALVNHLLIVTMDQTSYERCKFLRLQCYKLETEGIDFEGEKLYMSEDFIKMMWRRTLFLGDVLKHGYNFIFTDTDVLWLRNPFRHFRNRTLDLQISVDKFNGNEWSAANRINTGFYMIRSNNKTIRLFDMWYSKKDNSTGLKEQDVLENLIDGGILRKFGIRVRYLDTIHFSGFCQKSRDVRAVATVHANCCRSINAKRADLTKVIRDWKKYIRSAANDTLTFKWSSHRACMHSWKHR